MSVYNISLFHVLVGIFAIILWGFTSKTYLICYGIVWVIFIFIYIIGKFGGDKDVFIDASYYNDDGD